MFFSCGDILEYSSKVHNVRSSLFKHFCTIFIILLGSSFINKFLNSKSGKSHLALLHFSYFKHVERDLPKAFLRLRSAGVFDGITFIFAFEGHIVLEVLFLLIIKDEINYCLLYIYFLIYYYIFIIC